MKKAHYKIVFYGGDYCDYYKEYECDADTSAEAIRNFFRDNDYYEDRTSLTIQCSRKYYIRKRERNVR